MIVSPGFIPRGRLASPENVTALARAADELGLARVWIGDRLVYPARYESAGDLGRDFPWDISAPQLEGIVAMTWMLASTTRVGVGVSVMVIPLRQPLVLARQLASLDSLSGGRLSFGVGIGGVLEEYDCAGVDSKHRGARLDEYVEVLNILWTAQKPSFSGGFVSFPELYCSPKPARPDGIPLWFGGHTPAMWDRAARRGAGLAAGAVSPARAAELLGEVRRRAEAAGRDPAEVGILVMANAPTPAELLRLLAAHRQAGVTEVIVGVRGRTPDEVAESVAGVAATAAELGG